jgi:hypothetical protein
MMILVIASNGNDCYSIYDVGVIIKIIKKL